MLIAFYHTVIDMLVEHLFWIVFLPEVTQPQNRFANGNGVFVQSHQETVLITLAFVYHNNMIWAVIA